MSVANLGGMSNISLPFVIMKLMMPDRFWAVAWSASGVSFFGQIKCGVNSVARLSADILLLLSYLIVSLSISIISLSSKRLATGSKRMSNCSECSRRVALVCPGEPRLLYSSEIIYIYICFDKLSAMIINWRVKKSYQPFGDVQDRMCRLAMVQVNQPRRPLEQTRNRELCTCRCQV